MDIRWNEFKYSKTTKAIAVFLVWLCFMTAAGTSIFLMFNEEYLYASRYFDTNRFASKYSELLVQAVEVNVQLRSEPGIEITSASQTYVSPKAEQYAQLKETLKEAVNFAYYIKNVKTGDVLTNINAADRLGLLKKQETYVYLDSTKYEGKYFYYPGQLMTMLKDTEYELHAAVIEPFKPGDEFYEEYGAFNSFRQSLPWIVVLLLVSVLLTLAAFAYLVWTAGRQEEKGAILQGKADKIYTDVHTLLVFIAAVLSLFVVVQPSGSGIPFMLTVMAIVLTIDIFIGLSYVLSMVRQFKRGQLIKNSLSYKGMMKLRGLVVLIFSGKLFKSWTLLVLLGYGLVNCLLFSFFLMSISEKHAIAFLFTGSLWAAFNLGTLFFGAKALGSLSQLLEALRELSGGNLDYEVKVQEISPAFVGMAENLKNLQKGMKKAVSEAVKGERMKTELITNVSHDLKTPLTSIINYVDLLKQEELQSESAKGYVDVLEEKSARLKQLVEDLIEASKASSGNLTVSKEKVDLHQLVLQAYGEYEEKIEKAGLDIRLNILSEDLYVTADGRHLWRVVENLLSNALKYSMPLSRVYISIEKNDKYGVLTMKNVSQFPLEISPEQLTERFVRGDVSRTTEGSGLGLSIAQGLTQLQGGHFKIDIDGDLFKATVELPLWVE